MNDSLLGAVVIIYMIYAVVVLCIRRVGNDMIYDTTSKNLLEYLTGCFALLCFLVN